MGEPEGCRKATAIQMANKQLEYILGDEAAHYIANKTDVWPPSVIHWLVFKSDSELGITF